MNRLQRIACGTTALLVFLTAVAFATQTITGAWTLERNRHASGWQLQLSADGDNNSMRWEQTLPIDTAPSSADFTIRREAGTFHFTGTLSSVGGGGQFTFTPSDAFVSGLASRGLQARDEHELVSAATVDLTLQYIDSIRAAGYPDLSFDRLLAFRAVGATPQSIAGLRAIFGTMSAENVISTSALHVTPEYVQELRSMGVDTVTPQRAVTFKALHIDKAYVADLARMGYSHMDPQGIISFKAMHIDAAYLQHLRQHGLKNLTPQQVIEMKATGL